MSFQAIGKLTDVEAKNGQLSSPGECLAARRLEVPSFALHHGPKFQAGLLSLHGMGSRGTLLKQEDFLYDLPFSIFDGSGMGSTCSMILWLNQAT